MRFECFWDTPQPELIGVAGDNIPLYSRMVVQIIGAVEALRTSVYHRLPVGTAGTSC